MPDTDIPTDDPMWFKDAVIYELHVRAFGDSDGNGIGDFDPQVIVATRQGAGLLLRFAGTWKNRQQSFEVVT